MGIRAPAAGGAAARWGATTIAAREAGPHLHVRLLYILPSSHGCNNGVAETQRSTAPLSPAPAARAAVDGAWRARRQEAGPQSPRGGRGRSSGLGRLHPGQVHEEVPELRHVHVISAGGVPALSVFDEIPEPHGVQELQRQPADMLGYC